jgi:hypothetical protein
MCLPEYGNCDNANEAASGPNGCETSGLLDDINNCGACGNQCAGEGCVEGKCCWGNTQATEKVLTNDDCCPGLVVWQACDNNWMHPTKYTCSPENQKPTISHGEGVCSWSKK